MATDHFRLLGAAYANSRPAFESVMLTRLGRNYFSPEDPRVIELGSGTGLFSDCLHSCKLTPWLTLDSSPTLTSIHPSPRRVLATAEVIPVSDRSIDLVAAANCFHWFDFQPAVDEVVRVLRRRGVLLTCWSTIDRSSTEWLGMAEELIEKPAAQPRQRTSDRLLQSASLILLDSWYERRDRHLTVEQVVDLLLSCSWVNALSASARDERAERLRSFAHGRGGQVKALYDYRFYVWGKADVCL